MKPGGLLPRVERWRAGLPERQRRAAVKKPRKS
jgi:hypothetical protein